MKLQAEPPENTIKDASVGSTIILCKKGKENDLLSLLGCA
jgi:hypothetical protein